MTLISAKRYCLFLVLCAFSCLLLAVGDSAATFIASILVDLNHFPSTDGRLTSKAITMDASLSVGLNAIA